MNQEITNQIKALEELKKYSHTFFTSEGAEKEFLAPFGIKKEELEYTEKCEGGKGLSGYEGEKELTGISAFHIPPAIMSKLKIRNEVSCLGRGSQFRQEIDQIIRELKKRSN